VRVAVNDDVGRITSKELRRLRDTELVAVAHMDLQSADFDVDRRWKARIAGTVSVAEDRLDWCDDREFVEDLVAADVAGVKDQFDTGEGGVDLWTYEAVRVRNQAEPMDGGGGRWDVGGPRSGLHTTVGPAWQLVAYIHMVENPAHHEVNEFFDALGAVIETR
jgi:hypothetical protein